MASQLFDLFAQLGASEEQLDFPVLYASARQARSGYRVWVRGLGLLRETGAAW